jgi:hypothetical protein
MLNGLLSEGYACYTPDGGTRCEKTWFSEPDLIPEGRTLFWRGDVLHRLVVHEPGPQRLHRRDRGAVF